MRFILHPTALLVLLTFVTGQELLAQSPPGGVTRKAATLDSAARAEKESYQKALAALRASSPAEFDSTRALMVLVTHMALGRLGYISGPFDTALSPALSSAIRAYERDRGLQPTGDPLSFELSASLRADEKAFAVEPTLPSRIMSVTSEFVYLGGAWTFAEMGRQAIAVEVRCRRAERRCFESQAIYQSEFFGSPMLSTDLQEWQIVRWDDVEIATEPVDFKCARYVMRINLVQKTATKVRSTISDAPACSHQSKDDLIIVLSDGPELAGEVARIRTLDPFPALLSPAASAIMNRNVKAPPN